MRKENMMPPPPSAKEKKKLRRERNRSSSSLSKRVATMVEKAKARQRTDLHVSEWGKDGFARDVHCTTFVVDRRSSRLAIEEVSMLSGERFRTEYEEPAKPVLIRDIPREDKWNALEEWTIPKLKKRIKHAYLKCGEDDHGKTIRMKFRHFCKYMKVQRDDSPLYIFDSTFDERRETKSLLDDYSVPKKYFPDDWFHLVGEDRRPPYRWFLVGPQRSGTTVHIDPLGTSAWNTLLQGRKRWILFPPHMSKKWTEGKTVRRKGEDDEAINYFTTFLPRLKSEDPHMEFYDFVQEPGDTLFIPGGWHHGVLNLDDTVAITQNFCSTTNFDRVWRKTRRGRKRMAVKWLDRLRQVAPRLVARAEALNQRDDFVMYDKLKRKKSSSRKRSRS